ncbi:hypothetical protein [Marinicrinis lubricantis]|uniref:Type II secretion system protein GspF domain-containing protein n=1 Tax=Marinicrinis lubricantis TaxID=2086470 RepID=A0ABW1IJG2_9BACL
MTYVPLEVLNGLILGVYVIMVFICTYFLIMWVARRRSPYRWYNGWGKEWVFTPWIRHILFIPAPDSPWMEQYRLLLTGAGIPIQVMSYSLMRRMLQLMGIALILLGLAPGGVVWFGTWTKWLGVVFAVVLLGLLMCDRLLLEYLHKRRGRRIAYDLYQVSQHLLYYEGSRLNLHTKLVRCLPFTRVIKNEWYELINEWYYSASDALEQFKHRLGTNEAHSFAETLKAMHLQDIPSFYSLLRERIDDYKEKTELDREEQKEARSYILFVLAGIPILNTFRVFIYPWVQEGQRLFDSLNP